jgi:outer membrane protein TolC
VRVLRFKEVEKAKTVKSRTLEMKEQVKKGIMFEVSRAYYFLLEAKKRIELAESSRKSAEEALRIVEKRYKNGISTITELLDAQTFLNKARTEYVSALADYKKAVAELFFAVGIIDKRYQTLE